MNVSHFYCHVSISLLMSLYLSFRDFNAFFWSVSSNCTVNARLMIVLEIQIAT